MSTVAFVSAVLLLRHELLESLLRYGLWALHWMPQVFHKVSPSALSEIRCLLVSALGLILLQPRGSYPLPSLIEFHPMHMRFDGRPKIKGIPCRFLQLFLWATPFPPASALKTPAPSFSVFSAKCNLYVLLVFPLPAPRSRKCFQAGVWDNYRTHTVSFPYSDLRGLRCLLSNIWKPNFLHIDQHFSWLQREMRPISVILSWLEVPTNFYTYILLFNSSLNYSHFLN